MVAVFATKNLFGHDFEKSSDVITDTIAGFVRGLMSFSLNIPGTRFYKCMTDKDKLEKVIRAMLKERIACPEEKKGDFLDHAVKDLNTDFFLTENFILPITIGALFATVESISTTITLSFKLFAEHPWVVENLAAEHDILLKNRENKESPLTWDEYKSTFATMHVINEMLRLGNVSPGILRRTLKDINYNGYTIPAGWAIMIVTCTLQLNPNVFKDPLAFNPRRWKDIDPQTASKNFMPFGGGIRQCAGEEFSKAFFATFLHVLVSECKWTKIKGGDIAQTPMLQFQDGMYIEVSKKHA
ncbi:cytochrome P450 87A3-like [Camellia sinensis]|uniref:cytochrome P450 87A3-like n=1 Tax=Camellia sinensis TaxID=4442 RepID=UPI0010358B10|nr:cytochrome P450 87A3-like [Camellia sinensis]